MNIILLSVPRSGSTYVSELIRRNIEFAYVHTDPIDPWKFKNNVLKRQHKILDKIEKQIVSNSVFIRHNSHFFGLDETVRNRFEDIFKNNFYIIKLIRENSIFDITLSHCYTMLTNIPHDSKSKIVPIIEILPDFFLQELKVIKERQRNLEQYTHYNKLIHYSYLTNKTKLDSDLFKFENTHDINLPIDLKPNKEKHLKIENYLELLELYKSIRNDT